MSNGTTTTIATQRGTTVAGQPVTRTTTSVAGPGQAARVTGVSDFITLKNGFEAKTY